MSYIFAELDSVIILTKHVTYYSPIFVSGENKYLLVSFWTLCIYLIGYHVICKARLFLNVLLMANDSGTFTKLDFAKFWNFSKFLDGNMNIVTKFLTFLIFTLILKK